MALPFSSANEKYLSSSTKDYSTRDLYYRSLERLDPLCSPLFEISNKKLKKKDKRKKKEKRKKKKTLCIGSNVIINSSDNY